LDAGDPSGTVGIGASDRRQPEMKPQRKALEILLVEDNPADVRLTAEAFKDTDVHHSLHSVRDGVEAMAYLRKQNPFSHVPRPDVVLLDLNLPRKDGREVLAEIKADPDLRRIPVVVLTTSQADRDLAQAYDLHANCYITKPLEFDRFISVVGHIRDFWLSAVTLPPR
jgi:two-component system, chemotaxis family, response regulator Rcp1